MYCAKCGREIEDNEKFCPNCGSEMNDGVKLSKDSQETSFDKINNTKVGLVVLIAGIIVFLLVISVIYVRRFNPYKMENIIYETLDRKLKNDSNEYVIKVTTPESNIDTLGFKNIDLLSIQSVMPLFESLNGRYDIEVEYVEDSIKKIDKKTVSADYRISIKYYLGTDVAGENLSIENIKFNFKNSKWLWDAK